MRGGTGGRDLRGFGDAKPNSEVRWNSSFGVLALNLQPDRYDWRFHATDGADVDAGQRGLPLTPGTAGHVRDG